MFRVAHRHLTTSSHSLSVVPDLHRHYRFTGVSSTLGIFHRKTVHASLRINVTPVLQRVSSLAPDIGLTCVSPWTSLLRSRAPTGTLLSPSFRISSSASASAVPARPSPYTGSGGVRDVPLRGSSGQETGPPGVGPPDRGPLFTGTDPTVLIYTPPTSGPVTTRDATGPTVSGTRGLRPLWAGSRDGGYTGVDPTDTVTRGGHSYTPRYRLRL